MDTLLFWDKLRNSVRPRFFFLGLLFGFLSCCAAGKIAAGSNPYDHFRRFYDALQPGTDYYPTISQMIAIAREPLTVGKTLVIIGGNSVGFGIGQGDGLWSERLQAILGPSFAVRNFAMNGNYSPLGGAFLVFLSLTRSYQNIYYVTFSRPGCQDELDGSFYGYSYYWDARYKKLLPSMPVQEQNIEFRNSALSAEERVKLDETLINCYLDSFFYFRDLWTTCAYNSICTIWTKNAAPNFLLPRRFYHDFDPPVKLLAPERFAKLNQEAEVDHIRFLFPAFFQAGESVTDRVPESPSTVTSETQIVGAIPEKLRGQILQVNVKSCPYFLNKLSPQEKLKNDLIIELHRRIWRKAGCRQIDVGASYRDDDYIDAFHLSPAGGAKLAKTVAESLQALASKR